MFRSRGYFVLLDLINAEKNVPLIDLSVLLMSIDRGLLVSLSNKTWVFTGNVKVKTAPQELDWGPSRGGRGGTKAGQSAQKNAGGVDSKHAWQYA